MKAATSAVADAEAEAGVSTESAVEAEAVASLKAAKWGRNTVEAEELTGLDQLIARMQHLRDVQTKKLMKKACLKGDTACLKAAQEAEANKLKAKLSKLTLKPTIVDARKRALEAQQAWLKLKQLQAQKPEFVTPSYRGSPAGDFVKPEYKGDAKLAKVIGLPSGWVVPKRLNRRK